MLIVDDDPAFRTLAGLLSESGFVVVGEAESVAGALETARRVRPAAALVDVGLPDGDGFELARQLTALPWQPRVVLTSMHPNAGRARKFAGAGRSRLSTRGIFQGHPSCSGSAPHRHACDGADTLRNDYHAARSGRRGRGSVTGGHRAAAHGGRV